MSKPLNALAMTIIASAIAGCDRSEKNGPFVVGLFYQDTNKIEVGGRCNPQSEYFTIADGKMTSVVPEEDHDVINDAPKMFQLKNENADHEETFLADHYRHGKLGYKRIYKTQKGSDEIKASYGGYISDDLTRISSQSESNKKRIDLVIFGNRTLKSCTGVTTYAQLAAIQAKKDIVSAAKALEEGNALARLREACTRPVIQRMETTAKSNNGGNATIQSDDLNFFQMQYIPSEFSGKAVSSAYHMLGQLRVMNGLQQVDLLPFEYECGVDKNGNPIAWSKTHF